MSVVKPRVPELRFPEFTDEWQAKKLSDVGPVSMCRRVFKEETRDSGDIPFYKIGTFGKAPDAFIDKDLYQEYKIKYSFPNKGDILISTSGTIGRLVIYDGSPAYFQDSNIVWIANDEKEVTNSFLYYCYINTNWTTEDTTIARLYNNNLKKVPIIIPELSEQQKIADFLTTVDKKIELLERRLELLKQYKKGVMQKIFTQQIRFKDKQDTAYPDWEVRRIGEITSRVNLKNSGGSIDNVLTNSATTGIVRQSDYFDKDIANHNNLTGYYVVSKDDFVYNPRISQSAPVGPIKRNNLEMGVMSPLYTVFRFKDGDPQFFEMYFDTKCWHAYMRNIANSGARYDRMNITMADFYSLPVPYPFPEEQQKIADFLTALDDKIKGEEEKIEQSEIFKKSLLQRMLV